MSPLVVLLALAAVAAASPHGALLAPLAQPPHHPAVVLDPHGRPLDTAEVIAARSLHLQAKALEHAPLAHSVLAAPLAYAAPAAHLAYAAPAAVSHQSRVDIVSSPAVLGHSVVAPVSYAAHGLPHYLKKRSLGWGNLLGYSASPVLGHAAYVAPSAVSHQSRVDVVSSPAVVAHSLAPAAVYAAPLAYAAPSAVSHQSRVDVHSSPALLAHSVVAPVSYAHGLSHYLKKRSLGHVAVYAAPAAVSHQSRVDVHSSPAVLAHAVAPVAYAAAPAVYAVPAVYAAPAAVSHQSRVDVHSSPAVLAHSLVAPALLQHSAYSASPLHYNAW